MRKKQLPTELRPTVMFAPECARCAVAHKYGRSKWVLDDMWQAHVPQQCRKMPFWLMKVDDEFTYDDPRDNTRYTIKMVQCPMQRGIYDECGKDIQQTDKSQAAA